MKYLGQESEIVFTELEKADSIVIFGHRHPDGDCIGSIMGMKKTLLHFFPTKKVYAVGSRPDYLKDIGEKSDEVSDETIRNSLALMVDLSDLDRVEDTRITMAKKIVCVDHHFKSYEANFVVARDTDAPSATFVLTKLVLERYGSVPKDAAYYFYLGLVTDSGRFQFDSRPETLRIALALVETGIDTRDIYNKLYQQDSVELKLKDYVYSHYEFDGKVTYCLVPMEVYHEIGISQDDASCKVNYLALLDHHPIWAYFVQQEKGHIRVELRADGSYNVEKVAKMFNGGGHFSASGCKLPDFTGVKDVLKALNEMEIEHE